MLDYLKAIKDFLTRRREFENKWGGPFNGQDKRRKIFEHIHDKCRIQLIVETGTFKGNTTNYMHVNSGIDILTVEKDKRSFYYSKLRFLLNHRIKVFNDDSRIFLETLPGLIERDKIIFFYLDAHWNDDLPLKREVELIITNFKKSIIMIDDFKVPNDNGYAFDKYGDSELSLDYLIPVMDLKSNVDIFFPTSSDNETGSKRGCCVISSNRDLSKKLETIAELKYYSHTSLVENKLPSNQINS